MKYLKLFENFNELDIQDAKWIVISHLGEVEEIEIDPKWNAKNLFEFELQEIPTKEQIESCIEHLEQEVVKDWLSNTYNLKVDSVEANVWAYFLAVECNIQFKSQIYSITNNI